ncbi:hypothetical protein ABHN09_18470 [Bacillus paramobilis]|uniref:hypothetical protein n=1 Tax=Bacillus paramobilis TaxID=2817477 RepID=UPI003D20507A
MRQTRFLFVLIILILGACSNEKSFILKGESEHWKGIYNGYTYDEQNEKSELTLIYKGDPLMVKGNVKYKFETGNGEGSGDVSLTQKSIKINKACGGCATTDRDDVITIIVSWNEKTETFKLQSKK